MICEHKRRIFDECADCDRHAWTCVEDLQARLAIPTCFACLPPPPPIPVAPDCTCDPADGFGLIGGGWDPSCEMHGKRAQGSR